MYVAVDELYSYFYYTIIGYKLKINFKKEKICIHRLIVVWIIRI